MDRRAPRLAEQDVALARLLEDLLGEVPADGPQAEGCIAEASASAPLNDSAGPPLQGESVAEQATRDVPAWAGTRFRALLFEVAGHRFAMPLAMLHSVAALERRPTVLPQQPDWQIGVTRYRGQALRVVDLMVLLGLAVGLQTPRYLLVLGGGRLAVACDRIDDAVDVTGEGVKWRRAPAARAWLVGFLVDSLSAVLDPAAIEKEIGMVNA